MRSLDDNEESEEEADSEFAHGYFHGYDEALNFIARAIAQDGTIEQITKYIGEWQEHRDELHEK